MTESEAPIEQTDQPSPEIDTENRHLPRITITYCTQCKWMLRAAYVCTCIPSSVYFQGSNRIKFAQELLSTFGTTLGEVSLRPATGGLFTVSTVTRTNSGETLLWDRKRDGGFPGMPYLLSDRAEGFGGADDITEVKQLKALVRNIVDPTRNLGHVDRALNKEKKDSPAEAAKPEDGAKQQQEQTDNTATSSVSHTAEVNPPRVQAVCEDCQ